MKKDKEFIFKKKAGLPGRGYTFVETIIVLAILLIFISAAVMTYIDMRKKSRDVSEKALIATLQLAINQYHARYLVWPTQEPFTLMKYPPTYVLDDYYADGINWVLADEGTAYLIACPHVSLMGYEKGYVWRYYYSGVNTGKIILEGDLGH